MTRAAVRRRAWRRMAAMAAMLLASFAGSPAHADDESWWVRPGIQAGYHIQTGGGAIAGAGFPAQKDDGGGVAIALSFLTPARPRLPVGLSIELSGARAVVDSQTVDGPQTYGVASIRAMARVELWSGPPFSRDRRVS